MKLKNVCAIMIFTLTGIVFTNCTQQKHLYGNTFQIKSTSDTTCLNKDKVEHINESRKFHLEEPKSQLQETLLASITPQISFKKKIKNARMEVRIRKYKILYMDASNYLEKKEMKKCYDEFNSNDEVVHENAFNFLFSFPFVFIASLMFAIMTLVVLAKEIN